MSLACSSNNNKIHDVCVAPQSTTTLDAVFEAAFSSHAINTELYGSSFVAATDWKGNKRTLQLQHKRAQRNNIPNIPIFGAMFRDVDVTITQHRMYTKNNEIIVASKVHAHFVGSELFRVHREIILRQQSDGSIWMRGAAKHKAWLLPPPLKGIAESYMANQSLNNMQKLQDLVKAQFSSVGNETHHVASSSLFSYWTGGAPRPFIKAS